MSESETTQTLEDNLGERSSEDFDIDEIRNLILIRGQDLYRDLMRKLDELFENDSSGIFDKQLFLSSQEDGLFTYDTSSDYLLRNFPGGNGGEIQGLFNEQKVEDFLESRTNFANYVNDSVPLLKELDFRAAGEYSKVGEYFLRGISWIREQSGIGDRLENLRSVFNVKAEDPEEAFESALYETLSKPQETPHPGTIDRFFEDIEFSNLDEEKHIPGEKDTQPDSFMLNLNTVIAGGVNIQPDSIMSKIETLSGEEIMPFGRIVEDIDRYARARNEKMIGDKTLVEYLSEETNLGNAVDLFQKILNAINDKRPDDEYLGKVYQQLKSEFQPQTTFESLKNFGQRFIGKDRLRSIRELIEDGAEEDNASYALRNDFYNELRKLGVDEDLLSDYAYLRDNKAFIGDIGTVLDQLKALSEKEQQETEDTQSLGSFLDFSDVELTLPEQEAAVVSPVIDTGIPSGSQKGGKNYLKDFDPLERAVVEVIDDKLLPQEIGEPNLSFNLMAGDMEQSVKKINVVSGMKQETIEPKLNTISYREFKKGLDGTKENLNLEIMTGGSNFQKSLLKYGTALSAAAVFGIVATGGIYAMFGGYDFSQLFTENQVDDTITSKISFISNMMFSWGQEYDSISNEKSNAVSIQGAKSTFESVKETAAEKMKVLIDAVGEFTRVDHRDNTWKSVKGLHQIVDQYNPFSHSTQEIVADVSIANDKMTPEAWNRIKPEELRYPDGDYTKVNGPNPHLWHPGDEMKLGKILSGYVEAAKNSIQEKVQGAQLAYGKVVDAVTSMDTKLDYADRIKDIRNSTYVIGMLSTASALIAGVESWFTISHYKNKSLKRIFSNESSPEDQPSGPDGGSENVIEENPEDPTLELVEKDGEYVMPEATTPDNVVLFAAKYNPANSGKNSRFNDRFSNAVKYTGNLAGKVITHYIKEKVGGKLIPENKLTNISPESRPNQLEKLAA